MFQISVPTVRAANFKEAFTLIEDGGRWLNGGTDILVEAKEHGDVAARLVDISSIPELRQITVTPKKVLIGAAVTITEVMSHPVIRAEFPALAMSCDWFASPQIRNRATLAGNIANASPAGDTVPALYADDAVLNLKKKVGRRSLPISQFIQGVRKTALEPGELITEIVLPRIAGDHVGAFIKIGQRQALAISKTMIAISAIRNANGVIRKLGIALGAVAPTILRIPEAELLITGKRLTHELAAAARKIVEATIQPIDDIRSTAAYRRTVSGVITERALMNLAPLVKEEEISVEG